MFKTKESGNSHRLRFKTAVAFLASLFVVILGSSLLSIDVSGARNDRYDFSKGPKFCSQTAKAAFIACGKEAEDDYWITVGNCINLTDREERAECYEEAKNQLKETNEECRDQREARREVCELLGEERYDPDFDPGNFSTTITGNTYFPLAVGNQWIYEGGDETITVTVTGKTKLIEGVTCVVVNDLVTEDGVPIEDTDDWYAQHLNPNDVWYCGEIARNYELFEGDDPEEPELVDIDGSWKAGRDNAKPGILMKANPQTGDAYRQEMSLGEAEDVAEVLSNTYVFGGETDEPESLDYLVPEDLATLLCSATEPCVVTRDFSALEPGVAERKYYAPGIGVFLEVNLETEEIVQLVECNVNLKCSSLPTP